MGSSAAYKAVKVVYNIKLLGKYNMYLRKSKMFYILCSYHMYNIFFVVADAGVSRHGFNKD